MCGGGGCAGLVLLFARTLTAFRLLFATFWGTGSLFAPLLPLIWFRFSTLEKSVARSHLIYRPAHSGQKYSVWRVAQFIVRRLFTYYTWNVSLVDYADDMVCVCVWYDVVWCGVEWSGYGFLDNFMIYWNTNWWKVDVVFIQCSGFVLWIKWLACCRTALAKAIYVQSLCTLIQRYHMLQSISCFRSFKEEIRFWKFVFLLLDSETRPNSFWIRCECGVVNYFMICCCKENVLQKTFDRMIIGVCVTMIHFSQKQRQCNETQREKVAQLVTPGMQQCVYRIGFFSGWFRCWRLV